MPAENLMIVIGIDNYQHSNQWRRLKNARRDAQKLRDILSSKYNFRELEFMLDDKATRKEINKAIRDIISLLPDDNLIIFFAGHGNLVSGKLGYWVPHDDRISIGEVSADNKD